LKLIFLGKGLSGFLHWKITWFLVIDMSSAAGTVNEVEKFNLQIMYCTYKLGQWSDLPVEKNFSSCLKQKHTSNTLDDQLCNIISLYKYLSVTDTQVQVLCFFLQLTLHQFMSQF